MTEQADNRKICLIGGTGRCGTTLLSSIFDQHSEVTEVPEWRFLIDPDGILEFINNASCWSPYHVDIRIKRLNAILRSLGKDRLMLKVLNRFTRKFIEPSFPRKLSGKFLGVDASRYSPNFNYLSEELIGKLFQDEYAGHWIGMPFWSRKKLYYAQPYSRDQLIEIFREFYYAVIDDVLNHKRASYYLEKNTWNIIWFDQILTLLPSARLVHIYRDPRDVVASFTQQSWMPSDPLLAAKIYRDLFDSWQKVKKKVPDGSYTEVSLEQLSEDPEKILKTVCDFWGIPWSASLLGKDLSRSNSGRWKKQFNKEEVQSISAVLEEPLLRLGYE